VTDRDWTDNRHLTYQQRMKYCYRTTCKGCRSGIPSHGPYWYVSWREGGRVRSRYLGKQAPPGYTLPPESQAVPLITPSLPPQQPPLHVQTLGRFKVWRGGDPIPDQRWKRKKAAALFGILLSQPDFRLHRDQLCELLWPGVETEVAAGRLRSTVHQLRTILDDPDAPGSHLSWRNGQLLLAQSDAPESTMSWLDASEFEQLAIRALPGRDIDTCRQAIACYGEQGDYLPEFRYEDWATRRGEQLRERLIALLLHASTLLQEEGAPEEAERYLERILVLEPTRERAACALMALLHAQGRHSDGLRIYRALAAALADLDLQPEPETRRMRAALEDALRARVATAVLPDRSAGSRLTNLPSPISSFVGRTQELDMVRELLQTNRLITLTGIGGVGKTRLALAVGETLVSAYQDGVWLVELAALPIRATSAETLLCQTVARSLGIIEQAGEPLRQTLTEFLQPQELLLVLDNCEHVVQYCAELVEVLLATSPHLTVLATSREAFGIAGESVYVVPPLTVPDAGQTQLEELMKSEAVQLFVARAQAKRTDFALTMANARAVTQVCNKLEGIPLSQELASARLTILSVEQIAARLDSRLRVLAGGSRTALPRHQSLQATLHWSYNLLNDPERTLLRRLSVFAGGCDLDDVAAVCAVDDFEQDTIVATLDSLVRKSMVLVRTQNERAWYRLLETVREYGGELLALEGEEEALRERLCDWYARLAEQAKPNFRGTEQIYWLDRIEVEVDNIRTVLELSIKHTHLAEYGVRVLSATWQFWYMRNYITEGRTWLRQVLTTTDKGTARVRAEAFNGAGSLASMQNDHEEAAKLLEESLRYARLTGDPWPEACASMNLGVVYGLLGKLAQSLIMHQACLPTFRDRPDMPNTASTLVNIGTTLVRLEDFEEALPPLEESLDLFRSLGYKLGMSIALTELATVTRRRGDLDRAQLLIDECMDCLQDVDSAFYRAPALLELGAIADARGDYRAALARYREALQIAVKIEDKIATRRAFDSRVAHYREK